MLWLLGKLAGPVGSDSRRKLVLVATECARLAWPHVRERDRKVVLKCYETCEAYGRGDSAVTLEMVRDASYAANANASYAANAANAAAYAANAVDAAYAANAANAANAAAYAAYAANAAAYAAYAANAVDAAYAANAVDAARSKTLRDCADIVRKHYPVVPTVKEAVK